jgi:hypothetical protein
MRVRDGAGEVANPSAALALGWEAPASTAGVFESHNQVPYQHMHASIYWINQVIFKNDDSAQMALDRDSRRDRHGQIRRAVSQSSHTSRY